MKWVRAALAPMVATLLVLIAMPASAEPRVLGGVPSGTPVVSGFIYVTGNAYRVCSAALWRPRILLTAAHCVTEEGSGSLLDPARLQFTPVLGVLQVQGGGLTAPSPVRATNIVVPEGFVQVGRQVTANDIAAIVLDSDIAVSPTARLATRPEILIWKDVNQPVQAAGYGRTSLNSGSAETPLEVSLPLVSVEEGYRGSTGWTTFSRTSGIGDICSGDSGGPRWVPTPPGLLMSGVVAGGSCGTSLVGATSFVPITYLSVMNAALGVIGSPPIPGSPQNVRAGIVGQSRGVWWDAPSESPEAIVRYELAASDGTVLCETNTTFCSVPAASGTVTVRSVNAENEGDGNFSPAGEVVTPAAPRVKARTGAVRVRLSPLEYPGVQYYSVRTTSGKQVCRITADSVPLACTAKAKTGKHRYRVFAVTPQGRTAVSAWSPTVRVK